MNKSVFAVVLSVGFALQTAYGATIVSRPLPVDNLNGSSSTRSNIAWGNQISGGSRFVNGDSFAAPSGSNAWVVNTVTMWLVASVFDAPLGDEFTSISLLGGASGSAMSAISSTNLPSGSTIGSNSDVVINGVSYSGGSIYDNKFPIFQVQFNNLNWVLNPGSTYNIALDGIARALNINTGYGILFPHFTYSGRTSTVQDQANNQWIVADGTNLADLPYFVETSAATDLNMLITATEVPEPSSMLMLGAGLVGLLAAARARR